MLTHAASPHFSERTRQSWRTLGYGGIAVTFLSSVHASTTTIEIAAAAFVVPTIWNFVASNRERNGDKLPPPTSFPGLGERRELGDLAFGALFDQRKAELPFEDVITDAAYCSNEYGRKLSVICVRIPGLPGAMRDPVANLLRAHIRKKDEVEIASDEEFIVCSHLLRDALAADVIFKRLEGAFRDTGLPLADLEIQLGKAVYPMDGYVGADLIAHARSKLQKIAMAS